MPTNGHIALAWTRDYDDISPVKGIMIGGRRHAHRIGVDVIPELHYRFWHYLRQSFCWHDWSQSRPGRKYFNQLQPPVFHSHAGGSGVYRSPAVVLSTY